VTAKELLENADDDRQHALHTLTAATAQLKLAVLGVKRAQDRSMRADFKFGKVRYAIRKSNFSWVLRKRRCHPPVQRFNGMSVLSKNKLMLRIYITIQTFVLL
jgi:hypothetical protein